MPIDILMPALSPTMEEGTLSKWLVKAGDMVRAGDVIAEIETDKATMEVEVVDDGVVGEILVQAGSRNVKINTPIAVLMVEGDPDDAPSLSALAVRGEGQGEGTLQMQEPALLPHPALAPHSTGQVTRPPIDTPLSSSAVMSQTCFQHEAEGPSTHQFAAHWILGTGPRLTTSRVRDQGLKHPAIILTLTQTLAHML